MLKSRPRAPKSPSRRPRTDGVPLLGSVFDSFFIDFWFALDFHVICILIGFYQDFSKSNPEMKASSWKTVAATRALFFARTPLILEIFE